ncbi:hypothetical protein E2P64_00435 [Candidatus Bathyarchaeota archaeon]|nr:hypothetical protein E2P64_00435 [Candidatus Bathyarchaeota archaeon]
MEKSIDEYLAEYTDEILKAAGDYGMDVLDLIEKQSKELVALNEGLAINNIIYAPMLVKDYLKNQKNPVKKLEERFPVVMSVAEGRVHPTYNSYSGPCSCH